MDNCIFCQVVAGKLPAKPVYQDREVIVIPDIHPQAPVHWLVISKKHVSEFSEATDELITHIMRVVKKLVIKNKLERYRIVNNGRGAALIDHVHFHILGSVDKFRKL